MKDIYVLEIHGKEIFFSDALSTYLFLEDEVTEIGNEQELNIKIKHKLITEEEYNNLPEFDGF
jgi:hypothetical protein